MRGFVGDGNASLCCFLPFCRDDCRLAWPEWAPRLTAVQMTHGMEDSTSLSTATSALRRGASRREVRAEAKGANLPWYYSWYRRLF